jgi:glyoxylase-like metal-dependent hydrolase (beta-lactamase superfamily II)
MLAQWLTKCFWEPFETQARRTPFCPLRTTLEEVAPDVVCVRIDNILTRTLSRLAGGYDYSVTYVLNGTVMIDTGFPWAARALRRTLTERGWNRTLRAVINTHYHEDHVGNNDVVAGVCAVQFLGSAITAAAARLPPRLPWYRRFLFGPLHAARIEIAPDMLTVEGTELQLLATPGHCPGHLCVFVPEQGWLFSGDLFVAPDLDTQLPDVDGPDWIRSLEAVLALPITTLFDAHGTILHGADEVQRLLRQKCDFLRAIEARVREHLEASTSVEDLSNHVFGSHTLAERLALGDGWLSVLTSADFSRHHLVASFARPLLREQQEALQGASPNTALL